MRLRTTELLALRGLRPDGQVLLLTRVVRMFAYGFLAVILALYFTELGWENSQVGALLTITLAGNAFITLAITTRADRIGRKKMLLFSAALMLAAGITLLLTDNFIMLAIAGILGTISPTGLEVGAFAPIEQAALPQSTTDKQRTKVFAWYNLFGFFSTALGSLIGGVLSSVLQSNGVMPLNSYRVVIVAYLAACLLLIWIYSWLSPMMEAPRRRVMDVSALGLHISRGKIYRLAGLYALDAFAGGLVVQSLFAYWFKAKFGADEADRFDFLHGECLGRHFNAGRGTPCQTAWPAANYGLVADSGSDPHDADSVHAAHRVGDIAVPASGQCRPDGYADAPELSGGYRPT